MGTVEGSHPDVVGVVVGAGRGDRFGGDVPKQFRELGGKTIIERAVDSLATRPGIAGVVVVLAPEEIGGARAAALEDHPGVARVVGGGPTRAASVLRGVRASGEARYVLVHDAARPLAGPATVDDVVEATRTHGAAIPGLPVHDTVKEIEPDGRIRRTLDRDRLRLAQTPQGARVDWLVEALEVAGRDGESVRDEAEALERAGHTVHVVSGDPDNVKITRPADLERARLASESSIPQIRIGTGFDVHRFAEGRPLILGGVEFPGEAGLEGHSDADVVLHAAMDALLGASGLGDIGVHFPPEDERFAGADSRSLASRVKELVDEAGFAAVNLDLTVLAERPRIKPRAEAMRRAISDCLGLAVERIGLKATTLEGLGALGRSEGIACQAVALVHRRADR